MHSQCEKHCHEEHHEMLAESAWNLKEYKIRENNYSAACEHMLSRKANLDAFTTAVGLHVTF